MLHSTRVVFFDVDGVLVDSLPQHLQLCEDKAKEFGLAMRIPTVDEFRLMVSRGVRVSPMRQFFLAVGFPPECVDKAVADYEREFMGNYRPEAFPGVGGMLRQLSIANWKLGLVTSNTRANVEPALGSLMVLFEPKCVFFYDMYPTPPSKSWCIARGIESVGSYTESCVYVGDQPADEVAAREAGVPFLAVTYGWGFLRQDGRTSIANSVAEIPPALELVVPST